MKFLAPWLIAATVLSGMALCAPAQASTSAPVTPVTAASLAKRDPLVEGAMQCTKFFPRYEREYGIPTHLLSAIASTESGRYHQGLKIRLPWPWTVTANGKGQYFDSKAQAVAAVKSLKAKGVRNIDVGCMQVNLYHHADAFANVEQAFEPDNNINYAATFLRSLYNDDKSWKQAASDYHSKTPALGAKYIGLVYDSWFNIIQKLREARLTVPSSSLTAMSEMKGGKANKQLASAKIEPYPVAPAKPVYTPPRMNSIKVSSVQQVEPADSISYTHSSRDNGIMVVRADNSATGPSLDSRSSPMIITPSAPAAPTAPVAPVAPVVAAVPAVPALVPVAALTAPGPASYQVASATPAQASLPTPVQTLAVSENGSQASASVSVPMSGITQAAIAPVTGIANAVLHEASASVTQGIREMATPAVATPQVASNDGGYVRRSVPASLTSYKSGPNFIFNE